MIPPPDSSYNALAWGSHLAPLIACVAVSNGSILEVGVGHFSTPILHALCIGLGRELVSVESDREWHDDFAATYIGTGHLFINGKYDVVIPDLAKERWGVAFIDNSPGGERRKRDFESLLPVSEFVVVHDYHGENEEAIGPLLAKPSISSKVFRTYEPPTLVASLFRGIPNWV